VLEKTGFGDMIREVLNLLEKTVLWQFTSTDSWDAFKTTLLEAGKTARSKKDNSFDPNNASVEAVLTLFEHDINKARWGTKYSANEDKEPDDLGRPARLLVDVSGSSSTGSRTGKPLATTYNYYRRGGLIIREPKVVLEVRRFDNPLNKMQTSWRTSYWVQFVQSGALGPPNQVLANEIALERLINRLRRAIAESTPDEKRRVL
jgi:hypothetical protein